MCRAPQEAVPLTGRFTQAILRSANILSWPVFVALLMILPGCGATVDLAAERHAKAVKALIDLGAEVRVRRGAPSVVRRGDAVGRSARLAGLLGPLDSRAPRSADRKRSGGRLDYSHGLGGFSFVIRAASAGIAVAIWRTGRQPNPHQPRTIGQRSGPLEVAVSRSDHPRLPESMVCVGLVSRSAVTAVWCATTVPISVLDARS